MMAQRRKGELVGAEVLTILDSLGFGRLSDAAEDSATEHQADAGDPDAAERYSGCGNAAEDAMSCRGRSSERLQWQRRRRHCRGGGRCGAKQRRVEWAGYEHAGWTNRVQVQRGRLTLTCIPAGRTR